MEKDIDKIVKNPDTDIVVRIDDYGGKRGLTIREFIRGERYTGFTKAGTRIPADKFRQFKAAINSIDEAEFLSELVSEAVQQSIPSSELPKKKKSSGQQTEEEGKEESDLGEIEEQAM